MRILNNPEIVSQVFIAIEDGGFLPIGEPVLLEVLSADMDGIFPSARSWRAFVQGNFGGSDNDLSDTVKPSTIKRWCRPAHEYNALFVQPLGGDKFAQIDSADIELTFDYEPYWSRRCSYVTLVETYVTANIKKRG